MTANARDYALDFPAEAWTPEEREMLAPFVTNLDGHVTVLRNMPPELVGALCSRASRASGYLLRVLWNEYLQPLLADPEAATALREIKALHQSGAMDKLAVKGRAFYAKWLAQYGDDSIAQMTGTHIVFWGISQVAMKTLEDQRIGLEPIEKSTRYVQFGNKVGGKYLYYTPRPDLERLGLSGEYAETMDHLFATYSELQAPLIAWLKGRYEEKDSVLEKKAFDSLRGLLPMATLGQVAFRGNAQALEYAINRTAAHPLGELRWLSEEMHRELKQEIPSLILRLSDPGSQEKVRGNQDYLALKNSRMREFLNRPGRAGKTAEREASSGPEVKLVEFDAEAEAKVLTGMLYPVLHCSWATARDFVDKLSPAEQQELFTDYFAGRSARWQKAGRALENSYLRFDICMNIGAYRDLHRHRMMTQQRQAFSTHHGYDVPAEVKEAGLAPSFEEALARAAVLFGKMEAADPELAQYAVPLAFRMRFEQYCNLRQLFWEMELRTTSQGHPDYRLIEQKKFALVKEKFPLIASAMFVDEGNYPFARRGTEEAIQRKEEKLRKAFKEAS